MKIRTGSMMFVVGAFAVLMFPLQLSAQGCWPTRSSPDPQITEFDAPAAGTASGLGTTPFANNSECAIVGTYVDANTVYHGFLRTPDGKIISFDAPGASAVANTGTLAYSINDLGVIAGLVDDSNNLTHGFIRYPDGHFTTFDAPGAGTGSGQGTFAYNINLLGTISGQYFDANSISHGFVRWIDGHITSFDAPDASPTGPGTYVCLDTCINLEGAVTGYYYDAANGVHGFVRWRDGHFTEIDAPGASPAPFFGTLGSSINQEGTVAGYFVDSKQCRPWLCAHPRRRFHHHRRPGCEYRNRAGHWRFFD
jgi:hypothetical protein